MICVTLDMKMFNVLLCEACVRKCCNYVSFTSILFSQERDLCDTNIINLSCLLGTYRHMCWYQRQGSSWTRTHGRYLRRGTTHSLGHILKTIGTKIKSNWCWLIDPFVSKTGAAALAVPVTRSPATVLLTIQYGRVIVFHAKGFWIPVSIQCSEIIPIVKVSLHLIKHSARKGSGYQQTHYHYWLMILMPFKSVFHKRYHKYTCTGLILGLQPANERRRYKLTPSLIVWVQT